MKTCVLPLFVPLFVLIFMPHELPYLQLVCERRHRVVHKQKLHSLVYVIALDTWKPQRSQTLPHTISEFLQTTELYQT